MSDKEWRPKVGERVAIYGTVEAPSDKGFDIHIDGGDINPQYFQRSELSPLPAPAAPRLAWEVLEEAADVLTEYGSHISADSLRRRADEIKAAAAPKPPPTLAEAVRAYLDDPRDGFALRTLTQALARAEAEAGQ